MPPNKAQKPDPNAFFAKVADLQLFPGNPRKNDGGVDDVAASITLHGFTNPVLVQRSTGYVIAGNTRLKAARKLGLEFVPARYLDVDDDKARRICVADNATGEKSEWDDDALKAWLTPMDSFEGLFLSEDHLDRLGFAESGDTEPFGAGGGVGGQDYKSIYEVHVTCDGEAQQRALLEELAARGLKVRSLLA